MTSLICATQIFISSPETSRIPKGSKNLSDKAQLQMLELGADLTVGIGLYAKQLERPHELNKDLAARFRASGKPEKAENRYCTLASVVITTVGVLLAAVYATV